MNEKKKHKASSQVPPSSRESNVEELIHTPFSLISGF